MTLTDEKLLDEVGWALLGALQKSARTPFSELGRQVGLSAPAVAERVRRLEDAGIITGYRAEVDPGKLGLPLQAYIRISVENSRDDAFVRKVGELPEVRACDRVTGTDCYFVKVAVGSVGHLEQVITTFKAYGSPVTSLILSSPVPARGVAAPSREG